MIPWLGPNDPFPPVHNALRDPNGLLAAGADLSPARLLDAYSQGIFPWYNEGEPILWWSPSPRMVLFPPEIRITRSLGKTLRQGRFEVRCDTVFHRVLQKCAEPRPDQNGTWISPEIRAAYQRLHELGYAHSVESWQDGELVGGLYGIALGRVFYGESMFSRVSDASKAALCHLAKYLEIAGFAVIDCQMTTAHLKSMGGREIPRAEFGRGLRAWTHTPPVESHTETNVDAATRIQPGRWPADLMAHLFRERP